MIALPWRPPGESLVAGLRPGGRSGTDGGGSSLSGTDWELINERLIRHEGPGAGVSGSVHLEHDSIGAAFGAQERQFDRASNILHRPIKLGWRVNGMSIDVSNDP